MKLRTAVVVMLGTILMPKAAAGAEGDLSTGELTAIYATVHNGYKRERNPDGSYKTIRYTLGDGNYDPGSMVDKTLDHVKFQQLAGHLVSYLARTGYVPSRDSNDVNELIVVHWGRRPVGRGQIMELRSLD